MDSLSDNERVFAENYVISLRKDLAAIAAGYSERSAKEIGHQVYNRPNVKEYINQLLDQNTVTAKETLKRISDTSSGNMTDYMFPVERLKIPQVKRGLQFIIDQLQYKIEIEKQFLSVADLDEDHTKSVQSKIKSMELDIIRLDIELNKNPTAYRIIDGDPELVEEMELNLAAIVADKERGIIKSYKVTKDGIQVEMCDPDTSKDRMAKIHGLYEKDNNRNITVNLSDEPVIFK